MKKRLRSIEPFFVLLPIFVTFIIIFNIPDSKGWASNLTVLVSIYLIFRFPSEWKNKISDQISKAYIAITGLTVVYFSLMHLVNNGNFDIARSMFYCLIYFIFLPRSLVSTNLLLRTSSIAIIFGIISNTIIRDTLVYGRMHFSVNPIPYSFFATAMLFLACYLLHLRLKGNIKSIPHILDIILGFTAIISALTAILLTESRATWLALSICVIGFGSFCIFRLQTRKLSILFILSIIVFASFIAHTQSFQKTVARMKVDINHIVDGNYRNSSGIRLVLWKTGSELFQTSPLIGLTKEKEQTLISDGLKNNSFKPSVRHFIQTENANYHSQYIQLLVNSGIIGLMIFASYLILPALIGYKSKSPDIFMTTILFSIFSFICLFFDSIFLHNHLIYLYCFMTFVFYHLGVSSYREAGAVSA